MANAKGLPSFEKAVIADAKIVGYVLNESHDVGAHKARVFASALGIQAANWRVLEAAIRDGLATQPATFRGNNRHGDLYQVDVPVTGPKGSAIVRAGWIVREPGGAPFLTTAIVRKGDKP